jgi:hypothetical protein
MLVIRAVDCGQSWFGPIKEKKRSGAGYPQFSTGEGERVCAAGDKPHFVPNTTQFVHAASHMLSPEQMTQHSPFFRPAEQLGDLVVYLFALGH